MFACDARAQSATRRLLGRPDREHHAAGNASVGGIARWAADGSRADMANEAD
jgi:hypothetical protein